MIMPMNRIMVFACTQCDWRRQVNSRSCLLVDGMNHFRLCPDCGCMQLEIIRKDGLGGTVLGEFGRMLDRMLASDKEPTKADFENYKKQLEKQQPND